ncbi:MAG: hypothetical protein ACE5GC_02910 [Acidimicrobiia bacterium]
MLVRLRWFVLGALSSIGVLGWLAVQVKRARDKLTPANLARRGAHGFADALDALAERVAPTGD